MAPDELQPRPGSRRPRRGGGGRQLLLGARGVDRAHLRRELVPAGPAERQAAYHRAGRSASASTSPHCGQRSFFVTRRKTLTLRT